MNRLRRMRVAPLTLLMGLAAGLTPIAAEDTSVDRGPDVDLGEHWYGPECRWENLNGKVVLFVELVSVT